MGSFNKEAAVGIIHECAVLYSKNLCGKKVMFVTENDNRASFFETLFLPRNFLHLTGVKTSINSEFFYELALNQRLSPSSVSFNSGGTTEIKQGITLDDSMLAPILRANVNMQNLCAGFPIPRRGVNPSSS